MTFAVCLAASVAVHIAAAIAARRLFRTAAPPGVDVPPPVTIEIAHSVESRTLHENDFAPEAIADEYATVLQVEACVAPQESVLAVYDADAELQNAELKLQTALDLPDLQIPDAPLQAKVDAPPLDAPLKVAYPAAARRRGDEGTVVLAFNVNMARRAENIEVVRSSGHEALDAAAKSALEKATFAIAPGHSPDTRCTIPIAFRLSR